MTLMHHQRLISVSLVHHQCIISETSAHHQRIISPSSVHPQGIISASSVHTQRIISASSAHNKARPDHTRPDQTRPDQTGEDFYLADLILKLAFQFKYLYMDISNSLQLISMEGRKVYNLYNIDVEYLMAVMVLNYNFLYTVSTLCYECNTAFMLTFISF